MNVIVVYEAKNTEKAAAENLNVLRMARGTMEVVKMVRLFNSQLLTNQPPSLQY